MSKFVWLPPKLKKTPEITKLAQELNEPLVVAAFLYRLGLHNPQEARDFLDPSLDQLDDPYKMHDMKKTVNRIRRAIRNGEKITIYGDYDTDGITSTSIMYETLKSLGANIHYYIPNRFKDGYGPNKAEYKRIIAGGTTLMITVDNGISGLDEISYAEKHHCDVIITDHHDFPPKLPPAYSITMAAYPGHHYSYTGYCGAGIAFKVATALLGHLPLKELDLACAGTIADIVDIKGEDRILVDFGLQRIKAMVRPGFKAMMRVSGTNPDSINETSMGFSIIPRLNALGRLGDAALGVKLLTTKNPKVADRLANKTERMNRKRQKLSRGIAAQAIQMAKSPANLKRKTLVIVGQNWHEGVVGIVAANLVETFHKPSLVLNYNPETGLIKGSGRSVPGYDLSKAINPNRPHMVSFGGHPLACGMTIKKSQLPFLKQALESYAKKINFKDGLPEQRIDLVVPFRLLTMKLYRELCKLAPFGEGNPKPVLEIKPQVLKFTDTMGKNGNSLRTYAYGKGLPHSIKVISFGNGDMKWPLKTHPNNVSIIGYLNLNHWKGKTSLQFQALDFKIPNFNQQTNKKGKPIMPSKSVFQQLYIGLSKKPSWKMDKTFMNDIAKNFKISVKSVRFMLNVFYQLGFITAAKDKKGGLHVVMTQNPAKKSLTDSDLYQKVAKASK